MTCPPTASKPLRLALRPLATLLLGLAATAALAQPRYVVTDLGMPAGHASCTAMKVNDQGMVAGYCAPAVENFNQTGFVWKAGVLSTTGKLPKGQYSVATAINASGTVAGDADTGNFRPQGFVKTANGSATLYFSNNGGNTRTLFIADAGWIGGYYTKSLSGNTASWRGAIWTPDTKDPRKWNRVDLPVLPGGIDPASTGSMPWAFNQAGQAAGWTQNDQIGQHAAFWNNDPAHSVVDLGVFPGDWSSVANGINDRGQVVGTSHPPFGSRAVVWNNDAAHTVSELPPLPGDNVAAAAVINNLGHVVGTSQYGVPGTWDYTPARLVVWRDGGVWALNTLLDPVSGAGWTVTSVQSINNLGQMAGSATFNGRTRAVLLTPQP